MTYSDDVYTAEGPEGTGTSDGGRGGDGTWADVELLVRRALDLISSARPMPLSASVMINRDEVLELLEDALDHLPEELRAARWLLKEKEEFLAQAAAEAEEIVDAARARAERMVQRTEVVKSAEGRARKVVEAAEAEARRLRHECEDFCDQKLASFEVVLERTTRMVSAGRRKLQGTALAAHQQAQSDAGDAAPEDANAFFDQDRD